MYYDDANSIQPTNDGGYIFTGNVSSNNNDVSGNHGNDDMWVVKLNNSGTLQWQKCLGGSTSDIAMSVQQTADNGYVIAGKSNSTGGDRTTPKGANDFWIVKLVGVPTNTTSPPTGISNVTLEESRLLIYPNPASGSITVRHSYTSSAENELQIRIFNILGDLVYSGAAGKEETTIELSGVAESGVYFLKLEDANGKSIETKKLIID